jgi:ATP-dependent Clp protease ATP-binding subunit ClpA
MGELKRTFRPEFLNRLDATIVFHALNRDQIKQIVDLEIKKILKRLEDKRMQLVMTEAAREYLAEKGYDPHFGARPLRRVIQNEVEDVLSEGLLSGQFRPGDTVQVDARDGHIVMETIARQEIAEDAPQAEIVS